mgnify:CR=1 FL=1
MKGQPQWSTWTGTLTVPDDDEGVVTFTLPISMSYLYSCSCELEGISTIVQTVLSASKSQIKTHFTDFYTYRELKKCWMICIGI